ncbi:MAG: GWxTD domain-containing protein [Chitinophagales bacterium]
MKRIIFIALSWCLFIQVRANSLDCYLTVKRFYETTEQLDYIELSYLIPGNIVRYTELENKEFQAKLLIQVDLLDQENETVFKHTYLLTSPIYKEGTSSLGNLSDVLNIPFKKDSISLLFQVLDLNDSTKYFTDKISLNQLEKKSAFLSDVSLIVNKNTGKEDELFFKNGQILVPKFINFYPSEISNLAFYVEAYIENSERNYLMKYFISDENNVILEKYSNFKKLGNKTTEILYAELDISTLPSGNFYIYVELKDTANSLIDRKRMYFQRVNKASAEDLDKIDYYELDVIHKNFAKKYDLKNIIHHLKALKPIANDIEKAGIDGVISSGKIELMHNYFFNFWSERNSKNPEDLWKEYAEILQFVEKEYGNSLMEGHETERGRVYLQYGKPKEKIARNTQEFGRIEFWTYDEISGQGEVHFLFIESPNSNDEYRLIHSNLNGEIYNKDWAQYLKSNSF